MTRWSPKSRANAVIIPDQREALSPCLYSSIGREEESHSPLEGGVSVSVDSGYCGLVLPSPFMTEWTYGIHHVERGKSSFHVFATFISLYDYYRPRVMHIGISTYFCHQCRRHCALFSRHFATAGLVAFFVPVHWNFSTSMFALL